MIPSEILTNAPAWVTWVAQDADGTWWGFEVEPLLHDNGWYENEVGRYIRLESGCAQTDWRNSVYRLNRVSKSKLDAGE